MPDVEPIVDNQIFCTSKDLSVLSGALAHFCCLVSIISEKDFCKVERGNNPKLVQSTKPLFKS